MDPQTPSEEDAAMDAGFNSTDADESTGSSAPEETTVSAPADQQGAQTATPQESGSSETPVVDPFEGLPQAARALLAEVPTLKQSLAAADQRSRQAEGQVRSLQSQLDRLKAAPPAQEPERRLDKLQHAKQTLGHDMPEVMDALEELAGLLPPQSAQPTPAAPAAAPTPIEAPAVPQVDPVAQAHFQALDQVRPDWFETLDSPDCALWLTTRPDMAAIHRGMKTAGDALKVLNAFDQYRQNLKTAESTQSTRAERMAAAVVPTGNRRAPPRPAPMSEDEAMARGFNS